MTIVRSRKLFLLLCLPALIAPDARAQWLDSATAVPVYQRRSANDLRARSPAAAQRSALARHEHSYWVEGAALGAALLGTTGYFLYWGLCESDCRAAQGAASAVVAGLAGGTAGMLAGGMIPATRPRPLRGRPVLGTAVGAVAGALWGFGLLTGFCEGGCSDFEIGFGATTIAVTALAGFFVSLGEAPPPAGVPGEARERR